MKNRGNFICVVALILSGCVHNTTNEKVLNEPEEKFISGVESEESTTVFQSPKACEYLTGELKFEDLLLNGIDEITMTLNPSITLKSATMKEKLWNEIKDANLYTNVDFMKMHKLLEYAGSAKVVISSGDSTYELSEKDGTLTLRRKDGMYYCVNSETEEIEKIMYSYESTKDIENDVKYQSYFFDFFMTLQESLYPDELINYMEYLRVLAYEDEDIKVEGTMEGTFLPESDFESIKKFDYASYGLEAFENNKEIQEYSSESGYHTIVFKNDTTTYFWRYYAD